MSDSKMTAIIFLMMLSQVVQANETCSNKQIENTTSGEVYEKETVKQALNIVLRSQALTVDSKNSLQVDRNLLEEMRQEGLLKTVDPRKSSICVDPAH